MDTAGRVALVTGGTGGIGSSIVARLAREGYSVAIHYAGQPVRAEAVAAAIRDDGGSAIAVGSDIADEVQMSALFDTVTNTFSGVDVVVNTAGIMLLSPLVDLDLADLDRMHRINIRGTFVVSQLAARNLRRGGALINFSTSVTRLQFPNYSAYAASKGAVEAMTLVLARELRGRDITVNAVAPGPTATPLFLQGKSKSEITALAHAAPLERIGTPEDITEAVAFLAGPARWINGQTIFANGGVA
ncbi:SDR family oxidoreductase [Nocardia sp. NPDC052278]|uniref:SDR family oxidoreductase n=1 Tax=unclassified Nocardia TaxID=2637762 RepID=UPI0036AE5F8C